jgi:hypothetical protein
MLGTRSKTGGAGTPKKPSTPTTNAASVASAPVQAPLVSVLHVQCEELTNVERTNVVSWLRQRARYERTIAEYNTDGANMKLASWRSCVEPTVLKALCKYKFQPAKDAATITDRELRTKLQELV